MNVYDVFMDFFILFPSTLYCYQEATFGESASSWKLELYNYIVESTNHAEHMTAYEPFIR
jgi:hypothetical protein